MKQNNLQIQINKDVNTVFQFCITPPNSTLWIPGIVKESIDTEEVTVGTIYTLVDRANSESKVIVKNISRNVSVEWVSSDGVYHCRYEMEQSGEHSTLFKYTEWVDLGDINGPFTQDTLEKLKFAIEQL